MNKIIPFKVKQEISLCGKCFDENGLFYIGTDGVGFCAQCGWTVILRTSHYPDWEKKNITCVHEMVRVQAKLDPDFFQDICIKCQFTINSGKL